MEEKKIYIVRHGHTEYNKQHIVQGSGIDADLNDTGKKQAELFFNHFENHPFNKIYTSKLKRSIQSVQLFIDKGIPHEALYELNEMYWGNMEGKSMKEEPGKTIVDTIRQKWASGDYLAAAIGGESPLEVEKRIFGALKQIAEKREEKEILICMHGRALRVLLCKLLNLQISQMDTHVEADNLALNIITYQHKTKEFKIEHLNDTSYLKGYETPWPG